MARVLAVDDDIDILLVIQSALETAGHTVVCCSDPHLVRDAIRDQSFDAVVLDVMMPGLSGYELLRRLRSRAESRRTPILFLSARADSEARVRALRKGADDFLAKPFIPEELILRVEQLANRGSTASSEAAPDEKASRSSLQRTLREKRVIGEVFFGRYQAVDVIGEGAMGLVFRGWDPRLQRPVALKTLRFESLLDENHRHRVTQLVREATTVARFNHPNLVTVYDVGEAAGVPFIAMEYVDGVSLADYLQKHPLIPPSQLIPLAAAIANGLTAAHARDIVHQDIKPGNILLGRDASIKVTDFGVARLLNSMTRHKNEVFGTPGFLPPEALRGNGCGPRGDLFSLGSVLFECLAGEETFAGENMRERIFRTLEDEPPNIQEKVPQAPFELLQLIRELLAKKPEDRPASAEEVARRLAAMRLAATWAPSAEAFDPVVCDPGATIELHRTAPISAIDLDLDLGDRPAAS